MVEGTKMELSDPYEDNDFSIYFEKSALPNKHNRQFPTLPSFLDFLEDDNLFKIHMAEEDE